LLLAEEVGAFCEQGLGDYENNSISGLRLYRSAQYPAGKEEREEKTTRRDMKTRVHGGLKGGKGKRRKVKTRAEFRNVAAKVGNEGWSGDESKGGREPRGRETRGWAESVRGTQHDERLVTLIVSCRDGKKRQRSEVKIRRNVKGV